MFSILSVIFFTSIAVKAASPVDQLVKLGDIAASQQKPQEALQHYEEAMKKDPRHFQATLNFLRTRNSIGQQFLYGDKNIPAAREIFKDNYKLAQELYAMHPLKTESPFAIAVTAGNLALLSSPRDKVLLAGRVESHLKEALRLNPQFAYGYLGLGIFYKEISRITFIERFFAELLFGTVPHSTLQESEINLRKALALDPSFIFSHFHLADCLEKMGRDRDAVESYKILLGLPDQDLNDPLWKNQSRTALQNLNSD